MSFNIPTQTLGQVFQNQYPFVVPKYQRGYAWEQDELTDFLKDIAALRATKGQRTPHFMGGLMHVYIPTSNTLSRMHEVVDGQQRMATFTLLMSAISHGIAELVEKATTKNLREKFAAHNRQLPTVSALAPAIILAL